LYIRSTAATVSVSILQHPKCGTRIPVLAKVLIAFSRHAYLFSFHSDAVLFPYGLLLRLKLSTLETDYLPSYLDFQTANFTSANLRGANLEAANLKVN